MAMTIRPTDGLVHRLLQQQTRQSNETAPKAELKSSLADKVNISSQARQEQATLSQQDQSYGYKQRDLESQLLRLSAHPAADKNDSEPQK
ncbi:MAG: hypothetical protein Q9M19_05375 [Mariprofundaceae bacterium]|nr:hypothetical protein [Mariprofundaceae bacterium]